jgi:hypothetical protein
VSYIDIFCFVTAINYRRRQVFFGALWRINLKNSWTT